MLNWLESKVQETRERKAEEERLMKEEEERLRREEEERNAEALRLQREEEQRQRMQWEEEERQRLQREEEERLQREQKEQTETTGTDHVPSGRRDSYDAANTDALDAEDDSPSDMESDHSFDENELGAMQDMEYGVSKVVPTKLQKLRGGRILPRASTIGSPKVDHIQIPFAQTIKRKGVDNRLLKLVQKHCDEQEYEIPDRVRTLISMFFAKPITMKLRNDDNELRSIGISPILGTWDNMCRDLLKAYSMDYEECRVHALYLEHRMNSIKPKDWEGLRWNENDVFRFTVHSQGDPVYNICRGFERYYEFHGEHYTPFSFTEFCEESMYHEVYLFCVPVSV